MRTIINILLLIIIVGLGYLLYESIREPIVFEDEKAKREKAVANKLKTIRNAQQFYRDITGRYAASFDTLSYVLRNDSFRTIKVSGEVNEAGEYVLDTTYKPAYDTIQKLGWNLDSLRFVPYTDGDTFQVRADTIQYQKTRSPVVQVGVVRKKYMGPWGDARFAKYDDRYDPESMIKFGDMNKPSLSGNWE
jgi:hypothetical protein